MILSLKDISVNQGAVLPFKYELDLTNVSFYEERPLILPVKVNGKVSNHAGVLELEIMVDMATKFKCARCACEFETDMQLPIFHVLSRSVSENSSDDTIEIFGDSIDLDAVIQENIVLNMDMVHLCNDDCKGLCAFCGKNLNSGTCECKNDEIDPRLAPLQKLLDNKNYQ